MASDWSIVVERTMALSVEQIYRAWVEPELMRRWMAPGTMRVPELTIDAVEGGRWELLMQDVDGGRHQAFGQYTRLAPYAELALTWEWQDSHYQTAIVITIEEKGKGNAELCIEQCGFPSMDAAQSHEAGWNGCLDKLEKLIVD